MAGASVWALATVWAQAAVLSYKANVTLTGTIVAEAIVAAGVDASLFTAVMSAPRIVTETKSILTHDVSGAVYPEFGQKAWTPSSDLGLGLWAQPFGSDLGHRL